MCGLYGFTVTAGKAKSFDKSKLMEGLGVCAASRGTHATGISYNVDGKLIVDKAPKAAYAFKFNVPQKAPTAIGHTRHTTQGRQADNYNNHPFPSVTNRFALAHNGILDNDYDLQSNKELALPETEIKTDSYVAVQLLDKYSTDGELNMDIVKRMSEQVSGMFAFTVVDKYNNLWIVRNQSDFYMVYLPKYRAYVYASTKFIVEAGLRRANMIKDERKEVAVAKQSIVCIQRNGRIISDRFTEKVYYNSKYYANYALRASTQGVKTTTTTPYVMTRQQLERKVINRAPELMQDEVAFVVDFYYKDELTKMYGKELDGAILEALTYYYS